MKELIEREKYMREMFSPRMEYYFDEIAEPKTFVCPITGRKVNVIAIRRASIRRTPFVDVFCCPGFKGCRLCKKAYLALVNEEESAAQAHLH
jgi:predicted nucleotide-binding protein (sugar kinase/HSP70/actin superfamily)